MPYISNAERKLARTCALTEGELNYAITMLVQEWIERQGGVSYRTINAVQGVLTCVAHEFDREVVAPYEELKKQQNGDVWYIRAGRTSPNPNPL